MERDIQARLCVAAERMGTGLLRTGAALERIAAVMEKSVVTASQADKRPPDPVSDAKGGSSSDVPHQTNRPDLVTPPETH